MVRFGRRLVADRLVAWTAGNLSRRVAREDGLVAMSPTAMPYDEIEPDDVAIVRVDGTILEARRPPTSEFPLHTLVYQRRPDVGAIVHTHSPAAMAMAALGWTLPAFLTGFEDAVGGAVATAPYARPGTAAMADAVAAGLAERGACFLRHHGLLAIGPDLAAAYYAAAATETAADAYLRARAVADDVPELPPDEVARIAAGWRARWGSSPPDRG